MIAGGLLAGIGIKALTVDFARNAVEADRMSKSLGVSLEFFTSLEHALSTINIPADETSQVIADISERMFDASEGSKALRDDFALIGLTQEKLKAVAKEGPEAQFFALADALKETGPGAQRTFVAMSGLGDVGKRLLPLLELGSEGIKKLFADAKRLGVVLDQNAVKQAKIFNARMVEMKARLRGARNAIAMRLLPAVNDMAAAFSIWVTKGDGATTMLYALAIAAGVATIALASILAPKILAAWKVFIGQLKAILLLLRSITLQAALARIKLLAIVGGLVFMGLVIEDLIGFMRGDKSVTEQLFGRSEVILSGLHKIRDTFKGILDDLGEAFSDLWESVVVLAAQFGIKLTSVKQILAFIGKILFGIVVAALIVIGGLLTGIVWILSKIIKALAWMVRIIVDQLTAAVQRLADAFRELGEFVGGVFDRIEDAAFVVAVRITSFFERAADLARAAWRGFMSFLDKVAAKAKGIVTKVKEKLGFRTERLGEYPTPAAGPVTSRPGAGGVVTGNTVNVGGFVVNAAPGQSPREIARETRREFQRNVNRTFRDLVPTGGTTGAGAVGPVVID
jgi:Asp-tRNA(Asn)/Glu-tRNA(Gln) amidotransferase C subunit